LVERNITSEYFTSNERFASESFQGVLVMSHASQWLTVVVGLTLISALAGCGEPLTTPKAFKKFNAKDGTFAVEYPDTWKAEGGGGQGIQWAEFSKGSALVTINTNISGSVIADIAGSTNPGLDGDAIDPKEAEKLAPAAAAHNWIKQDPTRFEKFKKYEEQEPTKITPPIGEGRKSLFTATSGGRKLKGYRITIPTNDKALIIFAYAPEKDWSKVQGAYDSMFDKMEFGTPP
jgi:hypothetical protein